jgi:YHS domain-containing protein
MTAACLLFIGTGASYAVDGVNTGYFGNVAILGYDPVAYFTDGRAIKGSPEIAKKWLGATWYFASAKHRDAFASQPVRYAPQYGGFCTLGAAFDRHLRTLTRKPGVSSTASSTFSPGRRA